MAQDLSKVVILEFSPDVKLEALVWFVDKLKDAGFLVRCEPEEEGVVKGPTLHVSADQQKLLAGAEALGIRKPTNNGRIESITALKIDEFLHDEVTDIESLLTSAQKQFIVVQELQQLTVGENTAGETVPGYPLIPVANTKSLLQTYLESNLILHIFPLHDVGKLNEFLLDFRYAIGQVQPLRRIQDYFGDEKWAFYSFASIYTLLLYTASLGGNAQLMLDFSGKAVGFSPKVFILLTLFILFCGVLFEDRWRLGMEDVVNRSWPILSFVNEGKKVKVDQSKSFWSKTKRWLITHVTSVAAIAGIMLITVPLLYMSLWLQKYLEGMTILGNVWAVADALIFLAVGHYYTRLASFLTGRENHPTEWDFESSRIWKLVLFASVHHFLPLLYLTFWLQDWNLVKSRVNRMLFIMLLTSAFQSIPIFLRKHWMSLLAFLTRKWPGIFSWLWSPETSLVHVSPTNRLVTWPRGCRVPLESLEDNDPQLAASRNQRTLAPADSTFDHLSILELYVQFGYIFLTGGISPCGFLLGFLFSCLKLKVESYKLYKLSRRPLAKRISNIGSWITAWEILRIMAIMSSCWMLSIPSLCDLDIQILTVAACLGFGGILFYKLMGRLIRDHFRRPYNL